MDLIKTNGELNDIMDELCGMDDDYECFIEEHSDHYEPFDSYDYEGAGRAPGIEIGVNLARKSSETGKPIYRVNSDSFCFSAYFVKDLKEIKLLLSRHFKQVKDDNLEQEQQNLEVEIERIQKSLADADTRKVEIQKRLKELTKEKRNTK